MENTIGKAIIDEQIQDSFSQSIINDINFYFEKGRILLFEWLEMRIDDSLKRRLIELSRDYKKFQEDSLGDPKLDLVLKLLLKIISYCDRNAKDKNLLNQYEDKRVIATAMVRMNYWISDLIILKFNKSELREGSTQNAFNYLLDPKNNSTILSLNQRKVISNKLFDKELDSNTFNNDLIEYFRPFKLSVKNDENYTLLLSYFIYSNQDIWQEEINGLMASDNTGWQDEHISRKQNYLSVVWNSKLPSGTQNTINALRNILSNENLFYLYYASNNKVCYRASVIDFAVNQSELDIKQWDSNNYSILDFSENFDDYKSENKSAKIVFLIEKMEKLSPIAIDKFKFYGSFSKPTQDNLSPIRSEPIIITTLQKKDKNMNQPLNQILYGPPGTGKTYNTINHALKILGKDIQGLTRAEVKKIFDQMLNEGRIIFTTFHQSMSYEDFIEGIKPKLEDSEGYEHLIYEIKDGLFKMLCIEAGFSIFKFISPQKADEIIDFSKKYDDFLDHIQMEMESGKIVELESKSGSKLLVEEISINNNFIIKHPNGTRNYTVSKDRLMKLNSELSDVKNVQNIHKTFKSVIGGSNSSAYWSVLNAIQQFQKVEENLELNSELTITSYEDKKEIYNKLINEINLNLESKNEDESFKPDPYILIIDEINRGNVSQIFGELITLIEEDKRFGRSESLKVTLPYSKKSFSVPPNLYIIGTMNTADRSVEALDTALRRRFHFIEMPPEPNLIEEEGKSKDQNGIVEGINLKHLLTIINARIEKLLDKDHLIGHSYFMNVDGIEALESAFQNKIIPLLQEYFFGDYGKIGLVLGEGFFEANSKNDGNIFSQFGDYDVSAYSDRIIYKLKDLNKMTSKEFIEAINTLLRIISDSE